jgi:hypothetical protein
MTRYTEGDEYVFKVEKQIVAPDKTDHFVLKGPDNRKFLLPSRQYSHYSIKTGGEVVCRIDRINCRGRVFLEPMNPYYKQGKYYFFKVKGKGTRTDASGRAVRVLFVTDHFGMESIVEFRGKKPVNGTRIRLLVEKISKGKLILRSSSGIPAETKMVTGKEYKFVVEKLARGIDNRDYFVVKDPFGKRHMIPQEYYESYGLNPGSVFKGSVVKYRTNGEMVIEPENPFYTIGSVLKMAVTGVSANDIDNAVNVELLDELGHSHIVEMPASPEEDQLRCRVSAIRKGKPVLEVM